MTKPLLVTGARQVGKTYLINQFCSKEYQQYRYVNLLDDPLFIQIFTSGLNSDEKMKQMLLHIGISLDFPDSILFVDEVQESEEFISYLKYLKDCHPQVNIICAGSLLGVRLKRFRKSFPVGKVQIRRLYPMSFEEFLQAVGNGGYLQEIYQHYLSNTGMLPAIHEKLIMLYKEYCCIGGMPEAVSHYLDTGCRFDRFDISFFDDLITAYVDDMKKYVISNAEALKIERIYTSAPSQLGNNSARFQYSKAAKGARGSQYGSAIDWLLSASMLHKATAAENPEKPLGYFANDDVFKLYVSDVGMLMHLLKVSFKDFVFDRLGQAKGFIAENYVACELAAKGKQLHYWRSHNMAEIDFLLEEEAGVIPVEVKAGDNVRAKSLKIFCDKYRPAYAIRVSSKNFGLENSIKSVPQYAVFCLGYGDGQGTDGQGAED